MIGDPTNARGLRLEALAAVNRARAERGEEPLDGRGPSFFDQLGAPDEALLDRIAEEMFDTTGLPPKPPARRAR